MATGRAYWKGYLKLSLVTCPGALFPASSQSDKTQFHHRPEVQLPPRYPRAGRGRQQ